jgi:hypothetical protein
MDVERTMQFIVQQQAQFTNDIDRINAVMLDVANAQARTNEILATLAERQVATEETLNTLMLTVERHIANHE